MLSLQTVWPLVSNLTSQISRCFCKLGVSLPSWKGWSKHQVKVLCKLPNIRVPSHNNLSSILFPYTTISLYCLLFCRKDKDYLFNCSLFHPKIYLYLYCTCLHCLLSHREYPYSFRECEHNNTVVSQYLHRQIRRNESSRSWGCLLGFNQLLPLKTLGHFLAHSKC